MTVNFLTQFCKSRIKYMGIVPGKKWTLWTISLLSGFSGSLVVITHSLLTGNMPANLSAQYFSLTIIYIGLFSPLIYYREDILWICHECGSLPNINVPWLKQEFETLQKLAVISFERKYVEYHNRVVALVAFQTAATPIFQTIFFRVPLQLPFTGSNDNIYIFVFIYMMEATYSLLACISCIVMVDLFSMIVMHMKVHYQILEKAIIELSPVHNTEETLGQCIRHHQHLIEYGKKRLNRREVVQRFSQLLKNFEIFNKLRDIFTIVFFFIYFGLFSSSAATRALLMMNFDPALLGLIISETTYLSPYCITMEVLMDANQNLRFAFYSSNWLQYKTKINKSLQIGMIRTLKHPTIAIYHDGPGVNMKSYTALINATFTYLASALLM